MSICGGSCVVGGGVAVVEERSTGVDARLVGCEFEASEFEGGLSVTASVVMVLLDAVEDEVDSGRSENVDR